MIDVNNTNEISDLIDRLVNENRWSTIDSILLTMMRSMELQDTEILLSYASNLTPYKSNLKYYINFIDNIKKTLSDRGIDPNEIANL